MGTLQMNDIKEHWETWAKQYGTSLRATTKTSTAKVIEIDAISRALHAIMQEKGEKLDILEMGCGNGQNCLSLSTSYPEANFTGIDFIEEMIVAANQLKTESNILDSQLTFKVGDVLNLQLPYEAYDVVFTVRCLINLNTTALQQQAIASLKEKLKPGGYLLMIENSQQTYDSQNQAREMVGLVKRSPAPFNHFFDDSVLVPFLSSAGFDLCDVEDFITLHDLVLYVLVPLINGGNIDYNHPLVEAATKLNLALSSFAPNSFGKYGQNRLYKCRKRKA